MTSPTVRRHVPGLLLVVFAGVLLPTSAAQAHTRTQETTNLDSRITNQPDVPGVHWQVHTGGLLLEVVNDGDALLVVAGYEGEPYLRIGPGGVEHNRRSPATYLNDDRVRRRISARTDVAMPPDVDASAAPEWIRIDTRPRAVWHDHRSHWMSPQPPGFVQTGPIARTLMRVNLVGVIGRGGDQTGVFRTWEIPFTVDGRPVALEGTMAWEDPPGVVPYLLVAGVLVAPALLGLRRRQPEAILRPAGMVVLAVAGVNGIHLVDDLVAWPSEPLDELFGLLHTSLFLGVGIGGSLWSLLSRYGRVLALGVASGAVLYHQGVIYLPMLFASQFPTIWPELLVRSTIAAGLLQAAVVVPVIVHARRREHDHAAASVPDGRDAHRVGDEGRQGDLVHRHAAVAEHPAE